MSSERHTPPTKTFDVFLSHNSKDKPAVRQIAEALRDRGLRVWLDEWELVPGQPWQEALEEIIQTTRSSAVLVGKDGMGPWEIPEMRACIAEFVRRRSPVIPVLLPDALGSDHPNTEIVRGNLEILLQEIAGQGELDGQG